MKYPLIKVARTFRWEMGHRLPYHKGGCQNVHGHSYKMIVQVEGFPRNNGMVIDYYDIKALVQPLINTLDHSFMCSVDDHLMKEFLKDTSLKVVHVEFHSTAENIARYLLAEIKDKLQNFENLIAVTVKVYETESEYAEISEKLN